MSKMPFDRWPPVGGRGARELLNVSADTSVYGARGGGANSIQSLPSEQSTYHHVPQWHRVHLDGDLVPVARHHRPVALHRAR